MRRYTAFSAAGLIGLAAALGLVATGALHPARAAQEGAAAGGQLVRLAVVDLEKVMQDSKEWADCEDKLSLLRDKMRRTLAKYESQLKVLRSEYRNLPPDTEELREKTIEIERAALQYQQAKLSFERELETERAKALGIIFAKVSKVVEQHARENNIDVVLKKRRMFSARPQEINMFMASDVLYTRDEFDITGAVVARLNEQYPGEIKDK